MVSVAPTLAKDGAVALSADYLQQSDGPILTPGPVG